MNIDIFFVVKYHFFFVMKKLTRVFIFFEFFFLKCRTITLKDLDSGEVRVIYNAKEVLSGLKTPIVNDPKVTNKLLLIPLISQIKLFL